MESSSLGETEVEVVEGIEYDKGLLNPNFVTDKEQNSCELENPLVMIVDSKIESVRQIQTVLEHVIKTNKSLLIIGDVDPPVLSALVMNKMKGNIKVNVVDRTSFWIKKERNIRRSSFTYKLSNNR